MADKPQVVANMDETPLWFDIPSSSTVDFKGIRTMNLKTFTFNPFIAFLISYLP
jgi:hypothetical protein